MTETYYAIRIGKYRPYFMLASGSETPCLFVDRKTAEMHAKNFLLNCTSKKVVRVRIRTI
jgi:hypothetical protein